MGQASIKWCFVSTPTDRAPNPFIKLLVATILNISKKGIQGQAIPKALKLKPKIFTGQKHYFQSQNCVFCNVM